MQGDSGNNVRWMPSAIGWCHFAGFACYQALLYLLFFTDGIFSSEARAAGTLPINIVTSQVILAACLALLFVSWKRLPRGVVPFRGACLLSGMLISTAILLALFLPSSILCGGILSGIASGIGTAFASVLQVRRLSSHRNAFLVPALSSVVAAALTAAIARILPLDAAHCFISILPLISSMLVALGPLKEEPPASPDKGKGMSWYGAGWLVFGFSIGVLCSLSGANPLNDLGSSPWILAISVAVLAALLFTGSSANERSGVRWVITMALSVLIVVLIVAPALLGIPALFEMRVAASFTVWEVFLLLIVFSIARYYDASDTQVFLFVSASRTLGLIAGSIAVGALARTIAFMDDASEQIVMTVVVAACQVTLAMAYMLVKRRIDASAPPAATPTNLPLDNACTIIARRYRLTKRESEILALLAKGRTVNRIQEELVIAHGTVVTHMNHIYQKCNVHSRQELLDLCEEALEQVQ